MSAGEWWAGADVGGRRAGRFNEAPACLPGNGFFDEELVSRHTLASMRPRHVCRGMRPALPAGRPRCAPRFNEAPACLPGNAVTADVTVAAPDGVLQ